MAAPKGRRGLTGVAVAAVAAVVLLAALASPGEAVDRSKFRTCSQAAFCKRHRDRTAFEGYTMDEQVNVEANVMTGVVRGGPAGSPPLTLEARFYANGLARVRMTEQTDMPPRWEAPDIITPDSLRPATVQAQGTAPAGLAVRSSQGSSIYASFASESGSQVVFAFQLAPFRVDMYVDGSIRATANGGGKFHFEHRRTRGGGAGREAMGTEGGDAAAAAPPPEERKIIDWGEDGKPIYEGGDAGDAAAAEGGDAAAATEGAEGGARQLLSEGAEDEAGMWEESFGSHHDSKPNGPTSISIDLSFPGADAVYGIPEHASSFALKPTDGSSGGYSEPYRLYNLDVFEYELDVPMALYGAIPVMWAHTVAGGSTVGAFWNNPTETYVDVTRATADGETAGWGSRWISESGIVDLTFMAGPTPASAFNQFTALTGSQALPPRFALGYHQCRWNYKDEADVAAVDAKFEELNFPYDVLWLDIEHTDGKRYFTWDKNTFPDPAAMQNKLAARGRKMVTIVDPHIKRDSGYHIHSEAQRQELYIKNKDGGEFNGWCWPGDSSYLDFTTPRVRDWWAQQFSLDNYKGSTLNLYTWNDMNEPSVFNGPEVSMNKDAKSLDGVEHREWHNLYGFYQQMATADGLSRRVPDGNTRPFVLSRSFYAGSQRYGAMWTGDNAARWDHLQIAAPMLLSINMGGLSFAGADVGGFFGNPDAELLERWYQAGAFQPFFRAHAHIDTKRREPWLFGEDTLGRLRDTVRARYALLPFWYTTFYKASYASLDKTEGTGPVMRPLWFEYPEDARVTTTDDSWLVGRDLLVKPVTSAGTFSVSVYLPGGASQPWYDIKTHRSYAGGSEHVVPAPIESIPVFQRGGSIVPRQQRPRRCTSLMASDPYTLVVALDANKAASGDLYLDDGITYNFERQGAYRLRRFTFGAAADAPGRFTLTSASAAAGKAFAPTNTVERVTVLGLGGAPKAVLAADAKGAQTALTYKYEPETDTLTVRKPAVAVAYDFTITFEL